MATTLLRTRRRAHQGSARRLLFAGRPRVVAVFNVYHLLIDKADVPISVDLGDRAEPVTVAPGSANQVTTRRVAARFDRYLQGSVGRWELPGQHALNFVLDAVLGGTEGTSSLRYDPGKSYAAILLALPVRVPRVWEHDG